MTTYKSLPGLPAFVQYDKCLASVKEQLDIMSRQHPLAALQWLNEVQAMLNRARDTIRMSEVNEARQFYTDDSYDE